MMMYKASYSIYSEIAGDSYVAEAEALFPFPMQDAGTDGRTDGSNPFFGTKD